MKFSIKDFLSKCEQTRRKLRVWAHLLEKSLMENFIFCAVKTSSPLLPLTKTITAYQYIPQYNLGNYCTNSNEMLQNLRI